MTFEEIRLQIKERIHEKAWTDKQIRSFMERAEEHIELQIYQQVLIDHAAKIVIKMMKKKK